MSNVTANHLVSILLVIDFYKSDKTHHDFPLNKHSKDFDNFKLIQYEFQDLDKSGSVEFLIYRDWEAIDLKEHSESITEIIKQFSTYTNKQMCKVVQTEDFTKIEFKNKLGEDLEYKLPLDLGWLSLENQ